MVAYLFGVGKMYEQDMLQQQAMAFLQRGLWLEAEALYRRIIELCPTNADSHYNLAWVLRRQGKMDEAKQAYLKTLELGVRGPEEVLLNIAAICSDQRLNDRSEHYLQRALTVSADYVPALFNLAALYEEKGKKEAAVKLYRQILDKVPGHVETMSRVLNMQSREDLDKSLIAKLYNTLRKATNLSQLEQEAGFFALGRAYDTLHEYEQAFSYYRMANRLCERRNKAYDAGKMEADVTKLIGTTTAERREEHSKHSAEQPIFICGMFRSGTTLAEQILAGHSQINAGGELELLTRFTEGRDIIEIMQDKVQIASLADNYIDAVRKMFPLAERVTDKRPDNFIYLGLIRAMFPNAKVICTLRHPLDTCLSVYFQHLSGALPYASSLMDIAHYYIQYVRLLKHWLQIMPDNIHLLRYENLIEAPEESCKKMLDFCELPWQPQCLEFHLSDSSVKTASVWQVRQTIYKSSMGRWRSYEPYLLEVSAYLQRELGEDNYYFAQ